MHDDTTRAHDIVVFGATGFTGQLVAAYIDDQVRDGRAPIRWAIAGRNITRLQALAATLQTQPDIVVADVGDAASLQAMARNARVLLTTVGPYSRYGDPVVDAAVQAGTHYLDLTGEPPWVRRVIDRHHDAAKASGVHLVPCSGFDSVPSDLLTWALVRHIRQELGQGTRAVDCFFKTKGGFSGGTVHSMLDLAERYSRRELADPMLFNDGKTTAEQWAAHRDVQGPVFHEHRDAWVAPFLMAAINTRVVRRSAELFADAGAPYGEDFRYQEYMDLGSNAGRLKAWWVSGMLGSVVGLVGTPFGRSLIRRFGPDPGQGPSEAERDAGWFEVRAIATTDAGELVAATMHAPGADPGYKGTARLIGEGALSLALGGDRVRTGPGQGGVLTPAFSHGEVLLERLQAAGIEVELGTREAAPGA